jgi:hypothetical protein
VLAAILEETPAAALALFVASTIRAATRIGRQPARDRGAAGVAIADFAERFEAA